MDPELRAVTERLRQEAGATPEFERLRSTPDLDALAGVLTEPERPLWAREIAAVRLGNARDPRAFETLVLLLNHREPDRCAAAAQALARLGDPR
ncbi:adenylosuccinate lyase, partial [Streptomyces sp. T-3]|nr:adenylosuccinate lyase [Streptomyces sp. T-3]